MTHKKVLKFSLILSAIFVCGFLFQNCGNIHLHQISEPTITDNPPIVDPPQDPGVNLTFPPGYTAPTNTDIQEIMNTPGFACNIFFIPGRPQWIGTHQAKCSFQMKANQYYTFKFHVPTEAQVNINSDAKMGSLRAKGLFFALSTTPPNTAGSTTPTNCTNNNVPYLNWTMTGNPMTANRNDSCVSNYDTDYYITIAEAHSMSPTMPSCVGSIVGGKCMFSLGFGPDRIIVNEGYRAPPASCRYQPNNPIFAKKTLSAGYIQTPNGRQMVAANVNINPATDFGFMNVLDKGRPDLPHMGFDGGIGSGEGFDIVSPNTIGQPGSIIALKFKTPKFGENVDYINFQSSGTLWSCIAMPSGTRCGISPFMNISECPGEITENDNYGGVNNNSTGNKNFHSGYNMLQANGHYTSDPGYDCNPRTPCPQTVSGLNRVLKPNTIYYLNFYAGDVDPRGCGRWLPANQPQPTYCSPSVTAVYSNNQGILFKINDQH